MGTYDILPGAVVTFAVLRDLTPDEGLAVFTDRVTGNPLSPLAATHFGVPSQGRSYNVAIACPASGRKSVVAAPAQPGDIITVRYTGCVGYSLFTAAKGQMSAGGNSGLVSGDGTFPLEQAGDVTFNVGENADFRTGEPLALFAPPTGIRFGVGDLPLTVLVAGSLGTRPRVLSGYSNFTNYMEPVVYPRIRGPIRVGSRLAATFGVWKPLQAWGGTTWYMVKPNGVSVAVGSNRSETLLVTGGMRGMRLVACVMASGEGYRSWACSQPKRVP